MATKIEQQAAGNSTLSRATRFSARHVNKVLRALGAETRAPAQQRWLEAVAVRVSTARPDIAPSLLDVLEVEPAGDDLLKGLTIGEVGVCYEALMSTTDSADRRAAGQFFTPDDVAHFMAAESAAFQRGTWLDPCCGVGNLSWHIAHVQADPSAFVSDRLVLLDRDDTALRTAISLIAADYAPSGSEEAVKKLAERSVCGDFLRMAKLPPHDYVIANPPYAKSDEIDGYVTRSTRDLFAYFMERIATESRGYIAVTPAAYLGAPKFKSLRDVIGSNNRGGWVYVFDNVPDTLFRGYKYGSLNTSKTNFVRAAITVSPPGELSWKITPIMRWRSECRGLMFDRCHSLLGERRIGPHGEWMKISPGNDQMWERLLGQARALKDFVVKKPTPHRLDVALTPRYYVSAAFAPLDRSSKATLYFRSAEEMDLCAVVLNSSLPYLWWRALDGGVTLPRRVLMSVPIPAIENVEKMADHIRQVEGDALVTKLNAGKENQNIKHSAHTVGLLNSIVLPDALDLSGVYAPCMFARRPSRKAGDS